MSNFYIKISKFISECWQRQLQYGHVKSVGVNSLYFDANPPDVTSREGSFKIEKKQAAAKADYILRGTSGSE